MRNTVYTIGHSNHPIDEFVDILKKNDINCVCDARSQPYSKFVSQYNKDFLKEKLKQNNIVYLEFGKEFGARRIDQNLLTNGKVDFSKVSKDSTFLGGIERIKKGLEKGYRIALMCAEKDPIECHRNILVARNIQKLGIEIVHILDNGSQEMNKVTEKRLIEKHRKSGDSEKLFFGKGIEIDGDGKLIDSKEIMTNEMYLEEIYKRAEKVIAYRTEEVEE